MMSVEPLETRSTMPSARPMPGATSTAPLMVTMSTSTPSFANDVAAAARMAGGQSPSGKVREGLHRRGVRHGRLQAAVAVAQLGQHLQLHAALDEQVGARDAQVGHAVGHELHDVVRAHEEDVERDSRRRGW